ncbi:MAG: serine/threonine-protein kinase [Candidatus Obscuribacterales bacterium]|nr:serine/threonine-protein kinase [Candidatus Obscuribacterales bacterium]
MNTQGQKHSLQQTYRDAEARNKAQTIRYRRAYGHAFRQRLNLSKKAKANGFVAAALIYYLIGISMTHSYVVSAPTFFWCGYLIAGGLLCCIATLLAPEDLLYVDRLSLIVPGRNFMGFTPKVLWGKIEDINLLDLAQPGDASDFVMQLKQVSGETTNIHLSGLDPEGLKAIVDHMRTHAPHLRGLSQLNDIDRFLDYQSGNLPQLSYTQLWESANQVTFGLTSFTPLAPLAKIQEQYSVVRQIAAGGFSAIYLIKNEEGEEFVLKESVLPSTLDEATKAKATEQFQREATILSRLQHPQITTVYDHFVENGRNYLRLDFIKGLNMRQYVSQQSGQPEDTCIQWATQLAGILKYLHGLTPPVVHRDLSPDNIVVRGDGQLVLVDFGAANEFIGQATGTLVGKHAYMAPEQIRGNAQPVSDVYALGACVYFSLTGHDPEPIATITAKTQGLSISDWLDAFITRCTQLEIDERFATSEECLIYLTSSRTSGGHKTT